MSKKSQVVEKEASSDEFDKWLADNELNVFDEEYQEHADDDFLHTISHFVNSGVELTRIIVETERSQNLSLQRKDIFEIFNASMENIAKNIVQFGSEEE